MRRKSLDDPLHVCTLVLVPGVAAWVLGQPPIFPSLGPSAFVLVRDENEDRVRRVVGGHLIGVVSGLLRCIEARAVAPANCRLGRR